LQTRSSTHDHLTRCAGHKQGPSIAKDQRTLDAQTYNRLLKAGQSQGAASGTELLQCCTRHARCHDHHQLKYCKRGLCSGTGRSSLPTGCCCCCCCCTPLMCRCHCPSCCCSCTARSHSASIKFVALLDVRAVNFPATTNQSWALPKPDHNICCCCSAAPTALPWLSGSVICCLYRLEEQRTISNLQMLLRLLVCVSR